MRDSADSYQERYFGVFKLIQRGDRDVACPSEDPRRSRALTMLAHIRSEGLLTD